MGRLNFRHLYYFWSVAKEENLTRAAEHLHVSQSAVSSQIRQLENALGDQLFVREGRALRLTEFGSIVLDYAEGIFNLGAELLETVRGGEGRTSDVLRVGAVATLSRNFQQNLLRSVIGDEELRLVLESAGLEELLARLQVHKLDMILSNRPVVADIPVSLRCRRIARQSVCIVGPRPRKRFHFPDDLADVALLLPGPSSDIRTQFDLLCEEVGLEIRVSAEVDDMAMLRLLARDSGSVAVVPEVVVQDELANGTLHRYCELPEVYENFFAITARRQFQSSTLSSILEGI
jgi:LysR family transcriptional activator of nhaA